MAVTITRALDRDRHVARQAVRRPGTGDILLFAKAGVAPDFRETQRLPLVHQAAVGDRKLLLQATQLEVVARHFRRHADTHVVNVSCEAVGGRRRRAHLRSDAPEDIDFPERIEAEAV